MTTQQDMFGGVPAAPEQFRLVRMQVFNWGTCGDLADIAVSPKGFLIVGPSGSGKSTILDAHATLLTPPKWVGFNVAAREGEARGKGGDRNLMTYVRGAWRQQTGKNGEMVQQYLREKTTWSALAETYRSATRTVTIAQVFWVRGSTTDRKEIKRIYLVADREFKVEELQPFADKDFDLKLISSLPGVFVHHEFSGYGERFCRTMGIEQESALRLLHKTQSAKNLGDINDFLRDFTLEPPQTFDLANGLVSHFQALRDAHSTVVDTRRQIEVLAPARVAYDQLLVSRSKLARLAMTRDNVEVYKEQLKRTLLTRLVAGLTRDVESVADSAAEWRAKETEAKETLNILVGKRDGSARAQIALCETQLGVARTRLDVVEANQSLMTDVCTLLAATAPCSASELCDVTRLANEYLAEHQRHEEEQQSRREELRVDLRVTKDSLNKVQTELAALARRRSNIPSQLLDVRSRICAELGLNDEALPFAGELVDVAPADPLWKGAAERLMHSFAEHIVVPESHFGQAASFANRNHFGALVKLYRASPASGAAAKPDSLARKLVFAEHPLAAWVQQKAFSLFDHACVEDVAEMAAHRRAVTREGLIKTDDVSFRKDDRFRLDDRSKWILGGDTKAKVAGLMEEADVLTARSQELSDAIEALMPQKAQAEKLRKLDSFLALSWDKVDIVEAKNLHVAALARLETAQAAMPDMAALEEEIAQWEREHAQTQKQASMLEARVTTLESAIEAHTGQLNKLRDELLDVILSEEVVAGLDARFAATATAVELDNVESASSQVLMAINDEERAVQASASDQLHAMTAQLRDYIRTWPAKAANLDATEASAEDAFDILHELESDGLPKFEAEFLAMLQKQGMQEMMRLQQRLETERLDIKMRMAAVNASLKNSEFNKGTHLVIEPREKSIKEVMAFRQQLKEGYVNTLDEPTPDEAEHRFNIINSIVSRLESQETSAKAWRDICLDVRQHVEFVVRELNAEGVEVDSYQSGAGKSGGQRQKLTATLLAAALRYQLGGKETGVPKFPTVFMDEAFDKADPEFTELALKVFEAFGFQLVVATPLKSVMTFEPYIGGACFVHIEQRKHTRVLPIAYLESDKKLDLSVAGVSLEADSDI
jgi:uncharacterized protein YPO0396